MYIGRLNIISYSYIIIIYVECWHNDSGVIIHLRVGNSKIREGQIFKHKITLSHTQTIHLWLLYSIQHKQRFMQQRNEIIIDMYKYNDTTYTIKKPVNLNCWQIRRRVIIVRRRAVCAIWCTSTHVTRI